MTARLDGVLLNNPTVINLNQMTADVTTTVEGGTETHSRATTFNAYLSGSVASVTVVTDPGAVGPGLGPDFAATLFVNTVSVLRAR